MTLRDGLLGIVMPRSSGGGCSRRVVRFFQFRVLDRMRSAEDHQKAAAGIIGPISLAPMDRFAVMDQGIAWIECCAENVGVLVMRHAREAHRIARDAGRPMGPRAVAVASFQIEDRSVGLGDGVEGDPDGQDVGRGLAEVGVILVRGYARTDVRRLVEGFDGHQQRLAMHQLADGARALLGRARADRSTGHAGPSARDCAPSCHRLPTSDRPREGSERPALVSIEFAAYAGEGLGAEEPADADAAVAFVLLDVIVGMHRIIPVVRWKPTGQYRCCRELRGWHVATAPLPRACTAAAICPRSRP